jgi:hypothetical protein
MKIEWGKEYHGPGRADPQKTRAQRQAELLAMINSTTGQDVVAYYFIRYTTGGLESGKSPPVGLPMIETILNHEYPTG